MNQNAPLDEDWYNDEKRFVRNEKIVKIETTSLVVASILLLNSLYYTITPNPLEIYFWSLIGLLSDIIPFSYLFWWRKISIAYDTNTTQTMFVFPNGFSIFRIFFILNIIWNIIGLTNIYTIIKVFISSNGNGFSDFDWVLFFLFKAIEIGLIILSIYHIRETRKSENFVNQ